MKRFYIATVIVILMCISCSPETGILPVENASLVYVGESTETVDGVSYTVKSYADVKFSEPYFYTYYKYYYLSGNLRRLYVFNHGVGSSLDVPYTNFKEHSCAGTTRFPTIYTYHENGKVESVSSSFLSGTAIYKTVISFDSEGNKVSYYEYHSDSLYSECSFYSNGNAKLSKYYNLDSNPSYLAGEISYYESGNKKTSSTYYKNKQIEYKTEYYDSYSSIEKSSLHYNYEGVLFSEVYKNSDGTKSSEKQYADTGVLKSETDYYESGFGKIYTTYYSNGKIDSQTEFYDLSSSPAKSYLHYTYEGVLVSEEYYNSDRTCSSCKTYYEISGTLKSKASYYDSGFIKEKETYYKNGKVEYYYKCYDYSLGVEKVSLHYNFNGTLDSEVYRNSNGNKLLVDSFNSDGTVIGFIYYYDDESVKYYYGNGYFYIYESGKVTSPSTSEGGYASKVTYTNAEAKTKLNELRPQ